jgi:uncharacterized protein (TIGR00159 family)
MRWQSIIDLLVLATAIYLLLRWGRDARAFRVSLAVVGLRAAAVLARQLDLAVTGWILDAAMVAALIVVLLLFQTELRQALTRLDVITWLLAHPEPTANRLLRAIASAMFSLARARRGALVVISGREPVGELVEGGVPLGGEISTEILEAIFRKVSPVHDGATLIEGDHISRVGTLLPLTQRRDVPEGYGTRHRAAMGLAERCDALVIVVSEERGDVTLMHGREITTVDTPETLIRKIQDLRGAPTAARKRDLRGILFGNIGLKSAAVALAALLWSLSFLPGSSVRWVTVPVEFSNVPQDMQVSQPSAQTVQVRLRSSPWILDSVTLTTVVARFDLSGAAEGSLSLNVQQAVLNLPPGLILEGVAPQTISVRLMRPARTPTGRQTWMLQTGA